MNELNKIFSEGRGKPDPEKMINYLQGRMTPEERYQFEKEMNEDPFISEALDGLSSIDKEELRPLQGQLNLKLKKQLQKSRKLRRKAESPGWLIFAALLILVLILATWLVINALHHN